MKSLFILFQMIYKFQLQKRDWFCGPGSQINLNTLLSMCLYEALIVGNIR